MALSQGDRIDTFSIGLKYTIFLISQHDTIKTSAGISVEISSELIIPSYVADIVQPAAIEELQVMFMYNNVTGIITPPNRDQKIKT